MIFTEYRIAELIEHLRDITTKLFAPPHMTERGLLVTAGASIGIYTILHTFVDPGDYVFLPETTYPSFLSAVSLYSFETKPILTSTISIKGCQIICKADYIIFINIMYGEDIHIRGSEQKLEDLAFCQYIIIMCYSCHIT